MFPVLSQPLAVLWCIEGGGLQGHGLALACSLWPGTTSHVADVDEGGVGLDEVWIEVVAHGIRDGTVGPRGCPCSAKRNDVPMQQFSGVVDAQHR